MPSGWCGHRQQISDPTAVVSSGICHLRESRDDSPIDRHHGHQVAWSTRISTGPARSPAGLSVTTPSHPCSSNHIPTSWPSVHTVGTHRSCWVVRTARGSTRRRRSIAVDVRDLSVRLSCGTRCQRQTKTGSATNDKPDGQRKRAGDPQLWCTRRCVSGPIRST